MKGVAMLIQYPYDNSVEKKEVMEREAAQILGMGGSILLHNGILYRIQAQVTSRQ